MFKLKGRQNSPEKFFKIKDSYQLGHWAEEFACNHLKKSGFKILNRRFHTRFGEIDIIASKKDCLYFIEVKFRSPHNLVSPLASITPKKLKRFKKAVQFYMLKNPEILQKYTLQTVALTLELTPRRTVKLEWTPFFL